MSDAVSSVVSPEITIADGGIETALEERLGQELPEFAAFVLLDTDEGCEALTEYYRPFVELAAVEALPLALDTPTWRANPDWGNAVGYDEAALDRINRAAARFTRETAQRIAPGVELTVGGCIGPRYDDDGQVAMTADEAERYHSPQVRALVEAGVDRIVAVTMTDAGEAEGIVRAAQALKAPVVVSFAVGTDGRLPGGVVLARAILEVDTATESCPLGYFINCAHPEEAARALVHDGHDLSETESHALTQRVIGFRLNATRHGEPGPGDNAAAFAQAMLELRPLAPAARTFGGCCGTDAPHIEALAKALQGDETVAAVYSAHGRKSAPAESAAPIVPREDETPREFWERRYAGEGRVWSGRVNSTLAGIVESLSPGTALDLGCGEGGDVLWLAQRGWRATGIDLSTTAVSRARAAAAEHSLEGARFVAADLEEWVEESTRIDGVAEPLDLITASFLQSPVGLSRASVLRAALDRLAVGGHLVLVSHAAPPPWVKGPGHNHGRGHGPREYPTPESELAALGLDGGQRAADFTVVTAEVREREGTGPDGTHGKLDDTLVVVRRDR